MIDSVATVHSLRVACEAMDAAGVATLVAPRGFLVEDGGGNVSIEASPVHGPTEVARVLLEAVAGSQLSGAAVNGAPGLVMRDGDRVIGVACITVDAELVTEIWLTLNPAKLQSWNRAAPVGPDPSQP